MIIKILYSFIGLLLFSKSIFLIEVDLSIVEIEAIGHGGKVIFIVLLIYLIEAVLLKLDGIFVFIAFILIVLKIEDICLIMFFFSMVMKSIEIYVVFRFGFIWIYTS